MRDEVPAFDETLIEAEEDFVIDAQFLIQELLNEHNMSRAELARRVGISKARLTQLMKPDANPTLRTIARVLHALGEKAQVKRCHPVSLPLNISKAAAWFEDNLELSTKARADSGYDTVLAFRSMFEKQGRFVESQPSQPFDVIEPANDHDFAYYNVEVAA